MKAMDAGKKGGAVIAGAIMFMIVIAFTGTMDTSTMDTTQVMMWRTIIPLAITVGVVGAALGIKFFTSKKG